MEHGAFGQVLTLLAVAVVVVALFRRLHLPPILGYLVVGVAVGPHALGWFHDNDVMHLLGEIGVAFLLFTIGLEFSIPQFWAMRRTLLGLGGAQVLGGTVSGALIAWLFGIPWAGAVVVGGALALSSTAIVVKQLTDQLELQAPHGRLALGILLFQDLAAVPFLVIIPILAAGDGQALGWPLLYALLKGLAALVVMLLLGRYVLRPLFHEVGAARSPELFTLAVLLVSLATAGLTSLLGLSLALGAFLAGMMLGETEYRHQIELDIRPFRDVLLGLFFVLVGSALNLHLLPELWPWIILLVLGLVFGKGPLIMLLAWSSGESPAVALRTGLVLAHAGEFGFALLALALGTGLLGADEVQPILAAAVVSMLLAPIMVRHNQALAKRLIRTEPVVVNPGSSIAAVTHDLHDHVIICGYGRIGQTMARFLRDENLPYVALDLDTLRIRVARTAGDAVFYGDSTHRGILLAAGLEQARALVISFDDAGGALKILHAARSLRADLPILVRTRDDTELERLLAAGASEVVPETLEASLMLAMHLLLLLGVAKERVDSQMESVRQDRYQLLHRLIRIEEPELAQATAEKTINHRHSVVLPAGAHAVGTRLEEMGLDRVGVLVQEVHRGTDRRLSPDPDLVIEPGDILVLYGQPEGLALAERHLLMG